MKIAQIHKTYHNEERSAELAGLRYISNSLPGITRKKRGRGFTYLDPDGQTVTNDKARERFESLAIPPAWREVWISPHINSHIQATGRDDQGRKQYIYHEDWTKIRKLLNFYRLIMFGKNLPRIRRSYKRHLKKEGLGKKRITATVIGILDRTFIRVGNETYADNNQTYGLTTLQDEHVEINGETVEFEFTGKSNKEVEKELVNQRLAKIVKECKDVPGERLFQYFNSSKKARKLTSGDVNSYLKSITDHDFTSKDFRTWGGTLTLYKHLKNSSKKNKKTLNKGVEKTADTLANTKGVSKKHYIHPHIIEAWENDKFDEILQRISPEKKQQLTKHEQEMVSFLEEYFKEEFEQEVKKLNS